MTDVIKRILESLQLVRLIWLTESWEHDGYRTELRIVRYMGPRAEPWCWNSSGGNRHRVRLLADGSCKSRYRCTWEAFNERSPKPEEINTRDEVKPKEAGKWAA